jgi:5-carboxymethyl-2-hydroxymuconic-semialdehyde dehydrogenase
MTATWKTAPCLALGNTAVLKMSELSPLTANELGRLARSRHPQRRAQRDPGLWRHRRRCPGASPGRARISFTGGTATGKKIMQTAGLKKYSMELGGKSPVLIFEDADLERALDAALFTIFSLNGERCTAGSRIFIQESVYPQFVAEFAARQAPDRRRPARPENPGRLDDHPAHYDKVTGYIRIGIEEGAAWSPAAWNVANLPAHLAKGSSSSRRCSPM